MLTLLASVYCVYDAHGKHFYKLKVYETTFDKHKLVGFLNFNKFNYINCYF